MCHCEEGWKGPECDVPESDCRVADCSGHGQCIRGSCRCKPGWKGEACDEPDCEDTTCSDHGACVQGQCYCKAGWKGDRCDVIDEQVHKCLPSCSDHGVYDLEAAKCICNRHWTGSDCSKRKWHTLNDKELRIAINVQYTRNFMQNYYFSVIYLYTNAIFIRLKFS